MTESITGELRRTAHDVDDGWVATACGLLAIADRIDATYERSYREQIDSAWQSAWESLDNASDEVAASHGFVRLPVDADGETIRVGDLVDRPDGSRATVYQLSLCEDEWVVKAGNINHCGSYEPGKLRHAKPTPAERIREIASRIDLEAGTDKKMAHVQRDLRAIADELEADDD